MSIPTVIAGTIQLVSGKVIEFESPSGLKWLESINSFRFEPSSPNHAYTARKEPKKGGDYWYGYRKQNGKLHKKYIGKSPELSITRLEEIAEALNTPPQPRVTEKAVLVTEVVVEAVTDSRSNNRLTALELQVQSLQESLKTLQEALPGKSESGDSSELLKVDSVVTESELQIELCNLRSENESLRQELQEIKCKHQRCCDAYEDLEQQYSDLETVSGMLKRRVNELQSVPSATPPSEIELPEASDLLNKLKATRKKSTASLADIEALLEMIEES